MLFITLNKFWETNELLLLLKSSKNHMLPNYFRRIRSYIIYLDSLSMTGKIWWRSLRNILCTALQYFHKQGKHICTTDAYCKLPIKCPGCLIKNRFLVGTYLDCTLNRTRTLIKKIKKLKQQKASRN